MTNYICINGNKTELTEEQLKQLGIEVSKVNPFERAPKTKPFFYITNRGALELGIEAKDFYCNELYKVANYCTDREILEQRALHETLNRLLWRYSMEHDGDKVKWDSFNAKYTILYDHKNMTWDTTYNTFAQCFGNIYFSTEKTAESAIKEIIEPFMKAHPDFKF